MALADIAIKKPLTDAAIKALKPRAVRYYVSDGRGNTCKGTMADQCARRSEGWVC